MCGLVSPSRPCPARSTKQREVPLLYSFYTTTQVRPSMLRSGRIANAGKHARHADMASLLADAAIKIDTAEWISHLGNHLKVQSPQEFFALVDKVSDAMTSSSASMEGRGLLFGGLPWI